MPLPFATNLVFVTQPIPHTYEEVSLEVLIHLSSGMLLKHSSL